MELTYFALTALVAALLFTGLRLIVELPERPPRWIALGVLALGCLGLFGWTVWLLDEAMIAQWGPRAIGFAGSPKGVTGAFPHAGGPVMLALLRDGIGVYVLLGVLQGAVLAALVAALGATPPLAAARGLAPQPRQLRNGGAAARRIGAGGAVL